MSRALLRVKKKDETNSMPQSEVTCDGTPCLEKDKEEPLSYSQRVLQRLEKDLSSMVASIQIVMTELKSQLDKLNAKDSAQVESMLSVMETAVKTMVMAAGFYSSVPGVLGNETSAILLGTNTIPPLVKVYKPEGRTSGSSGLTLKKTGRSYGEKGKGRAAGEALPGPKEIQAKADVNQGPTTTDDHDESLNATPKSHPTGPPSSQSHVSGPVLMEATSPSVASFSTAGYSEMSGPSMEVSENQDLFADKQGLDWGPIEKVHMFGSHKPPVGRSVTPVQSTLFMEMSQNTPSDNYALMPSSIQLVQLRLEFCHDYLARRHHG